MKVSYNVLWKLLIDYEMKKMDLVEKLGISTSTLVNDRGRLVYIYSNGFEEKLVLNQHL